MFFVHVGRRHVCLHQKARSLTAQKQTAKATKSCRKAAQKAAEKGPRQQKPPQQDQQRPQLEDDGWTIVTYSKSRLKHPHTAPEKRVPEERVHHIMMTYNQRNKEKADSNANSCSSLVANHKRKQITPTLVLCLLSSHIPTRKHKCR
jgi:hypothetical protein